MFVGDKVHENYTNMLYTTAVNYGYHLHIIHLPLHPTVPMASFLYNTYSICPCQGITTITGRISWKVIPTRPGRLAAAIKNVWTGNP